MRGGEEGVEGDVEEDWREGAWDAAEGRSIHRIERLPIEMRGIKEAG